MHGEGRMDRVPMSHFDIEWTGSFNDHGDVDHVVKLVIFLQLEVFRRLHDADEEEYYNYRPLQKRNGRTLKYFKVPDSSETDGSETGSSPGAGGNGGGTQAISLIKTTITNTLQEVNSLFSNIINVLSDAQLCEPEEQYMLELLRSKNITKLSQLQEFKKIGEGITKVKEAKKTKPIK